MKIGPVPDLQKLPLVILVILFILVILIILVIIVLLVILDTATGIILAVFRSLVEDNEFVAVYFSGLCADEDQDECDAVRIKEESVEINKENNFIKV